MQRAKNAGMRSECLHEIMRATGEIGLSDVQMLDATAHRGIRIRADQPSPASDRRHFVELVISEIPAAAVHYPIFLAKVAETGAFFIGALRGFREGENLFADEPPASGLYRPLAVRREPFFSSGEHLALDLADPRVGTDQGEWLFDEDATPSPYLRSIQGMITRLHNGQSETAAFVRSLAAAGLVEPIDIMLDFDDGERCRLDGLYTISNEALHQLSDQDVLALLRSGSLRLAFAIIQSLGLVPLLAGRRNERLVAR